MNKFVVKRFDGKKGIVFEQGKRIKKVTYGYLYIHFLQDNLVDGSLYKANRTYGIKLIASTKMEAINIFDNLLLK